MTGLLNPFTTGNPFLGTKLLGFSIERGSGALKGLTQNRQKSSIFFRMMILDMYLGHWIFRPFVFLFRFFNRFLGEILSSHVDSPQRKQWLVYLYRSARQWLIISSAWLGEVEEASSSKYRSLEKKKQMVKNGIVSSMAVLRRCVSRTTP